MREILFRGFREYENGKQKVSVNGEWHKGEWVCGYPVIDTGDCSLKAEGKCLCPHDGTSIFFWNDDFHEYTDCEIIPETVGQYTGLTDKNGTKIFEGDIIKAPDNVGYEVKWQPISASWQMKNERLHCLFYIRVLDMFEVIGNIHENPDLLKGEAE